MQYLARYKLLSILTMTLLLSACAGKKVELDRGVFEQQQISKARLSTAPVTLSPELSTTARTTGVIAGGIVGVLIGGAIDANTNSARAKKLEPLNASLADYSLADTIQEALEAAIKGPAFAEQVTIDRQFDEEDKKPYLVPTFEAAATMAADFKEIRVLLTATLYQNKDGKRPFTGLYSATQLIEGAAEESSKDDRYQFWSDNPEVIVSKLKLAIDEVVAAMVSDFNAPSSE